MRCDCVLPGRCDACRKPTINKETLKDLKPYKVELPDSVWMPEEKLCELLRANGNESSNK